MNNILHNSVLFARRELRQGLHGFRILIACLILGVSIIAVVGSLVQSIKDSIRANGQTLLGGDIEITLRNQDLLPEAALLLSEVGEVSRVTELLTMISIDNGERFIMGNIKAVDTNYPLYGELKLVGELQPSPSILSESEGQWGIWVDSALSKEAGLDIGDELSIGQLRYRLRGIIEQEPDDIFNGIQLAPRVMVANSSLPFSGLIRTGSLVEYAYRIKLPQGSDLEKIQDVLKKNPASEDWRVRDYNRSSPGLDRFVERIGLFLTLVGLSSLLVGGIGISNAVNSYLQQRASTIATLKSLGAESSLVFASYFLQIFLIALFAIGIGLILGAVLPAALYFFATDYLPLAIEYSLQFKPLMIALVYGVLITITFMIWPLARSVEISPATLFRSNAGISNQWVNPERKKIYISILIFCALVIAAFAILTAVNRWFTFWFILSALGAFIILGAAGWLVKKIAGQIRGVRHAHLRLVLSNISYPGAATIGIVLSLGLGVTLLTTVALIQGNLAAQLSDQTPDNAPSLFFVGVQESELKIFSDAILAIDGSKNFTSVPMVNTRITKIRGEDASTVLKSRQNFNMRISLQEEMPGANRVIEGEWWPKDYKGKPLLSLSENTAREMEMNLGDTLTLEAAGKTTEVTLASIREVDWASMNINFRYVITPNSFTDIPLEYVSTVQASPTAEVKIHKMMHYDFPAVNSIRVRDMVQRAHDFVTQMGDSMQAATVIALIAGILVLAGAMAADYKRRVYNMVLLKVLGATRREILLTYLLEYALLGVIVASIAILLALSASYAVIVEIMNLRWIFLPEVLAGVVMGSIVITALLGFSGSWRTLGQKSAPILRTE